MLSIHLNRTSQLVIYLCLSIGLMLVDHHSRLLQPLRHGAAFLVRPVHAVAAFPSKAYDWSVNVMQPLGTLQSDYNALQLERQTLLAKLQRFESLEQENTRLNLLLSASKKVSDEVLLAELVEVSLDPFTHRVLVNKGVNDGVYIGQAVIDTQGVVGQVTQTSMTHSAVTLITDPNHAIPIQVLRNGLRAVVQGVGSAEQLNVPFLARHADIGDNDILVTSGMGGRFPAGYPVARITEIIKDANAPFLEITATPVARLGYAREVLLIWPGSQTELDPPLSTDE